jgi:IMP dehydrogenase
MDKVVSLELLTTLTKTFNLPVTIHRFFNDVEDQIKFYESCNFTIEQDIKVFLAVGILSKWQNWIERLFDYRRINNRMFNLLVDVANGDTKGSVDTVKFIRDKGPIGISIMSGNVATKSGFKRLQEAGSNFIRVGIGGGSICSTRTTTGFGMPTLTSIFDCAKVKDTAYLIADGGLETTGDICKAIGAGADLVMLGKMLADRKSVV